MTDIKIKKIINYNLLSTLDLQQDTVCLKHFCLVVFSICGIIGADGDKRRRQTALRLSPSCSIESNALLQINGGTMSRYRVDLRALSHSNCSNSISPIIWPEWVKTIMDPKSRKTMRAVRFRQRQIRKTRVYKSVFFRDISR